MNNNHKTVIKKYQDDLFKCNHVNGVGFGPKEKDGEKVCERSIVIMVDKKVPEENLNSKDIIPQKLENYKTDVIEVGELKLLNSRTQKMRPAQPGVSIGHYEISAGTFGAVVKDKNTGNPLILSNNHVLANLSNGRDNRAKKGDSIIQPAKYDDGSSSEDVIGHLERFVPLLGEGSEEITCPVAQTFEDIINYFIHLFRGDYQFKLYKKKVTNIVDCAVARPKNKNSFSNEILEIGKVQGIRNPETGLSVQKSGRTTGLTKSRIRTIDSTVEVRMSESKKAIFEQQFITDPMSRPGDSGSLVLTEDNKAVGLLFAGSDRASVSNNILNVVDALDIEF